MKNYMRLDASPEEMQKKGKDLHAAAKALQQKLKAETKLDVRKQITKQMDELFCEVRLCTKRAKQLCAIRNSVERDFINMGAEGDE